MARTRYNNLIEELHGATSPGRIHRQKRYRAANGKIIGFAAPETYDITHPRDWNRKPARGDEKVNQQLWGKACHLSAESLETDEGYNYWMQRFEAQLTSTRGSKPDEFASLDPKTKTRKRYKKFDAFVKAIIRNQLKAANDQKLQK